MQAKGKKNLFKVLCIFSYVTLLVLVSIRAYILYLVKLDEREDKETNMEYSKNRKLHISNYPILTERLSSKTGFIQTRSVIHLYRVSTITGHTV